MTVSKLQNSLEILGGGILAIGVAPVYVPLKCFDFIDYFIWDMPKEGKIYFPIIEGLDKFVEKGGERLSQMVLNNLIKITGRRGYSERKLETASKLYYKLESKKELIEQLVHASRIASWDVWVLPREEVAQLIDKTRKKGLAEVPLFKNTIDKLTQEYNIK